MPGKILLGVLVLGYILVWGVLLRYLDEHSAMVRRLVRWIMRFSRASQDSIKSVILTIGYLAYGIGGIVGFGTALGADLAGLFSGRPVLAAATVLAFVTEINLMALVIALGFPLMRMLIPAASLAAAHQAPWIQGISRIRSPAIRTLVPGLSGFVEEVFFRGSLGVGLVTGWGLSPVAACAATTVAFLLQQGIQLRGPIQTFIIGSGCLVLSIVGTVVTFSTGSVLPAAFAHAAFAVFYVRWNRGTE